MHLLCVYGLNINYLFQFYSNMNLSPEKLQKKMDECSKHRYKYKPPEETLPGIFSNRHCSGIVLIIFFSGFWDLSFEVP